MEVGVVYKKRFNQQKLLDLVCCEFFLCRAENKGFYQDLLLQNSYLPMSDWITNGEKTIIVCVSD